MKLLLTGILLLTTAVANAGTKVQTWDCYTSYAEVNEGAPVIVSITSKNKGKINVAGITHKADYHVDGFDRRWDFEDDRGRYSFTLSPDKKGYYFDFTNIKKGAKIQSSMSFFCLKQQD